MFSTYYCYIHLTPLVCCLKKALEKEQSKGYKGGAAPLRRTSFVKSYSNWCVFRHRLESSETFLHDNILPVLWESIIKFSMQLDLSYLPFRSDSEFMFVKPPLFCTLTHASATSNHYAEAYLCIHSTR